MAAHKFNMIATMNPSGDFGKKELSPALRNRMTEIWVESYFEQIELHDLLREARLSPSHPIQSQVSESIDLYLIVKELCCDMLGHMIQDTNTLSNVLPRSIFNIICYVSFGDVSNQDNQVRGSMNLASLRKRKTVSIRDVLNIIQFIKVNLKNSFSGDLRSAFKHAIELVIIDGICLGSDQSVA